MPGPATLLEIVRNRLIDVGVADQTLWPVFIGYTPDDQDKVIGLEPTGGFPADTMRGENLLETFQVKVRASKRDYLTCEGKWREVFNALQDADLSSDSISLIQALATGPLAWYDENSRPCMSVNFRVVRTNPTCQ